MTPPLYLSTYGLTHTYPATILVRPTSDDSVRKLGTETRKASTGALRQYRNVHLLSKLLFVQSPVKNPRLSGDLAPVGSASELLPRPSLKESMLTLLPPVLPDPPAPPPPQSFSSSSRRRAGAGRASSGGGGHHDRDQAVDGRHDHDDDHDDEGGDASLRAPPPRKAKRGLTRDQWAGLLLFLVVAVGGSRAACWATVKVLDAWCIALDLSCKPKGY